jgi:hypothetical protein
MSGSSATLGGEAGYLNDPWDRGYGSLQCSTRRPLSLCRWNVLIVSIAEGISIPVSFNQAWRGRAADPPFDDGGAGEDGLHARMRIGCPPVQVQIASAGGLARFPAALS